MASGSILRVLHVTAPTVAGGLERVVEGLTVGLRRRGHEVHVAVLRFSDGNPPPLVEALDREGVAVHEVRLAPRAYLRERREIARLCATIEPDVLHTHGFRADVVDRGVAARLGIPTVTTVHGRDLSGGLKGRLYEWLQRRSYRNFGAVVTVSSSLHESTLRDGVPADRLHLVPNAWSGLRPPLTRAAARRELDLADSAQVIGWIGRMSPVKGGDVFIDAFHALPTPRPIGVMIGYGEQEASLRAQAADLGLEGHLRILPAVPDAGRLISAFDAFVLSSRSEGLPIVVLEAMAAGTPIAATLVGGVGDVLSPQEALLVPSEDPAKLAAAIDECLTDRERAVLRADAARRRLDTDFATGPWLDRYEAVYSALR